MKRRRLEVAGKRPLEAGAAGEGAEQPRGSPKAPLAYSISEFCKATSISVDMFHKLRRDGEGPAVFHIGRRTLIAAPTARAWIKKLEKEAAKGDADTAASEPSDTPLQKPAGAPVPASVAGGRRDGREPVAMQQE